MTISVTVPSSMNGKLPGGGMLPAESFGANPAIPASPQLSNKLLDALSSEDFVRWRSLLEPVTLNPGQVLASSGLPSSYVYFPVDCLISLMCLTAEGGSTEIALIGNEGIVGVSLFMGESAGASQAVVQCGGLAYRMKASTLADGFQQSASLRHHLLRYLQALLAQSAQMAVCNRHHSVEQQFCRWLLSAVDRLPSNELTLTQELIANTLGVRRAGVTEAASRLRRQGLIACRRGRIEVLDRQRLQHHACECYGAMRREFQRLVPPAGTKPLRIEMSPIDMSVTLPGLQPLSVQQTRIPAANDYGHPRELARESLTATLDAGGVTA